MLQHYRNQQKLVYCANLMFFLFALLTAQNLGRVTHPRFSRRYSTNHNFQKPVQNSAQSFTYHHEFASTISSCELQTRKAAANSRCRTAPVRFVRTGLLSMVRRFNAGKVLCWGDMSSEWGVVLLSLFRGLTGGKAAGLSTTKSAPTDHLFLPAVSSRL